MRERQNLSRDFRNTVLKTYAEFCPVEFEKVLRHSSLVLISFWEKKHFLIFHDEILFTRVKSPIKTFNMWTNEDNF
jgi:hypothetical protein